VCQLEEFVLLDFIRTFRRNYTSPSQAPLRAGALQAASGTHTFSVIWRSTDNPFVGGVIVDPWPRENWFRVSLSEA
jgi:hypothetical protein